MLTVCATGHRWEGLGITRSFWSDARLELLARSFLVQLRPHAAISGFALGWDMAFARAALSLDIPLLAALPGAPGEQSGRWRESDAAAHRLLVERCAMVEHIGEGYAFGRACILRDKWMVEHSHVVCAMWSGAPSGTGKTVGFAERAGLPVVNLWGLQI
jgi:hypothetical protein